MRKVPRLYPYFPGYRYYLTALSDRLGDDMIALLGFMDVLLKALNR
jgi:hypothetical protein